MNEFLFAVVRGVIWAYGGWLVATNGARQVGYALGSKTLVWGKWRQGLNRLRRDIHASFAALFLVIFVVLSVHWEYTGKTPSLARLVPMTVVLFFVELLLGGGHRKPVWNPWEIIRQPGSALGLIAETATGGAGFTEVGALFDRKRKRRRSPPPKRAPVPSRRFCPDCGSAMVQRTNRATGAAFLGCSTFPRCRGTRPI